MSARHIPYILVGAAVAAFVWSPATLAHRSVGGDRAGELKQLVEEANLVVVGEVAEVKYVNVQVEGEGEIPHTIVTYRLRESFRGKPGGETLALRFIGGADGRGGFLSVSGVPVFQEGEQDILFVETNGADGSCPLVNCEYGRFRVHQNRVFNTHGQPVRGIDKNNAIARGRRAKPFETFKYPAPKFDDLLKNAEAQAALEEQGLSVEEARRQYRTKAPKEIVVTLGAPPASPERDQAAADPQAQGRRGAGGPPQVLGEEPVTRDRFVSKIKELQRQSRRTPQPIQSVDPNARISLKRAAPAAAGKPPETPGPRQLGEPDAAELKELESQGFNPVLRKKNN